MEYSDEYYKNKYLKYKTKYDSELIKQNGGSHDLMEPNSITIPFSFLKYLAIGAGVFYLTWSLKGYNDRRTAEKNNKIKILKDEIIKYGYNIGKILDMTPTDINKQLIVKINDADLIKNSIILVMTNIITLRDTITINHFYGIIENRKVLGRMLPKNVYQSNQNDQNQEPIKIIAQTNINGYYHPNSFSNIPDLKHKRYATDIHLFEYFMLGLKYTSDKILEKIQKYSNTNIVQADIESLFKEKYEEKNYIKQYILDSI